jgi:NAD(P)-dependent dehydrogenase (short-subunit alcohol dehydrogenase family)
MSLEGMNAVITGSASGIGRACAMRLAQGGADIAILDINGERLVETARLVDEVGRRCLPVTVDLLDHESVAVAFGKVKSELGPIAILHNNAGGSLRRDIRTFPKSDSNQWDCMLGLNLRQVADCTRPPIKVRALPAAHAG